MAGNTEELEKATADFNAASREIAKQLTGKAGNAAEIRYSEAHQRLVRVGGAQPLKRKYTEAKKFR